MKRRVVDQACLEEAKTKGPPVSGGQFVGVIGFDIVGGIEAGVILLGDVFEVGLGFVIEDGHLGEEAVAEGVHGGTLFAGVGFGAGGALGIGTIGREAAGRSGFALFGSWLSMGSVVLVGVFDMEVAMGE